VAIGDSAYERLQVLARLGATPLIGRDSELALLRASLGGTGTAPAPRTVIAVSGEPGAGKTRLVAELVQDYVTAGAKRVWLPCYEQTCAVPYAPFLDPTSAFPTIDETLANIPQGTDSDAMEAAQLDLHHQVDATLVRYAAGQRLVIAVDDLQWADGASLDLLRSLARRGRGERLILLTIRADERSADSPPGLLLADLLHDRLLLDLTLSPLSHTASDALLRELLGEVDHHLAAMVYKRSGGLPYFIEEIVRTLVADESIICEGGVWRLANQAGARSVPVAVAALVLRRVARLPVETREALEMAAVVGERFDISLLADALRRVPSAVDEALQPALRARILRAGAQTAASAEPVEASETGSLRFAFNHALTRETIYGHIPPTERRTLHGLLARTPKLASSAAMVAYHAERAHDWALTYDASLRAGDDARRALAGHDVLTHLRRARSLASLGEVTVAPGERLALDQRIVETLVGLGQMAEGASDARLLARQARELGEPAIECWAFIQLGAALTFAHELDEAQRSLEHACDQARALGENALLANALSHVTVLLVKRGLLDQAEGCMLEALSLAETLGDPSITLSGLDYLGYLATWRGQFETAIHHFEQARDIAEDAHDALSLASARFGMAMAQAGCARYEDALENLRELQRFSETTGEPYYAARVPNTFGWVYRELGLIEDALTWDLQAVRETEVGDWPGLHEARANSLLNLGSDLIELQRLTEAEAALDQAAEATERDEFMRWRNRNRLALCRGELALARGDHDRALVYALAVAAESETRRSAKYVSLARDLAGRALAALGKSAEARSAFEEALRIASEIGYIAGRWRTLARLVRLLLGMGATQEAHGMQVEARAVIDSVARGLRTPELRERFLMTPAVRMALDPIVGSSATSQSVNRLPRPDGLSGREIEVLGLLAHGMTNREIALALVISERTVNSHLAHIFNKLGVSNRAAAAAYALRNGLAE
jgi:DNA-binding CsgD family transcriptional regulator/tetratricopeptide (TPR) repeat protein